MSGDVSHAYEEALEASLAVREAARDPIVGLILGSGLGAFVRELEDAAVVPYGDIPNFPRVRAEGHAGELRFGHVGGVRVAVLSGRVHFYEGHGLDRVTLGARTLALLGVKALIVTNAAGGIRDDLDPGTLMLIEDHLNLMGTNPLIGHHDARLGARFPDMSEAYDRAARAALAAAAAERSIELASGVYAALSGPSYETPAEIRMLRTLGADAVGMSTVPEAIVARHMGIEVLGISCITNLAAGVLPRPLNHDEVLETAQRVRGRFLSLLNGIIARI